MDNKVKVLYIAGCGRTGSTIIGNALGQVQGFTHVGELLELWGNLAPGRPPCGCGVPVNACKMWEQVLKEAYGCVREPLISQMLEFRNSETGLRNFPRAAISMSWLRRRLAKPLVELERLYRAIQRTFNCQVIVDSSKYPMYLYFLHLIDAIDPYVLHLVRDPRAWAYAFLNKTVREGYVLYLKPLTSSRQWNARNWAVEAMSGGFRHCPLRLRYEDFVANPRESLQRIQTLVGAASSLLPLRGEHIVNLNPQHTVSGNPNRFMTGDIEIRDDCKWRNQMKRQDRMLVTATTWPLMLKYGYLKRTPALQTLGIKCTNRGVAERVHPLE